MTATTTPSATTTPTNPGIHLFVPMLHRRDAVGEHTRTLRDLLVADGVPSRIYTELPDPDTVDETRPYLDYGAMPSPATSSCTRSPPVRTWPDGWPVAPNRWS